MKVLVGCECSGVVRDAFIARGHDAWSCDIKPSERPGPHIQRNILEVIGGGAWDLMIAHPDCTYLCNSGIHWNCRTPGRAILTRKAIDFAEVLWAAPIPKICIENPVGCLASYSNLMAPAQYIQPYAFGHDASKKTGLWLKGLPPLVADPAWYVKPRIVNGKPRWANQTDAGQNRETPSDHRSADRARTYEGVANCMALTWG